MDCGWCEDDGRAKGLQGKAMGAQAIVEGMLKPDGTLELDQKPNLSPGRVRVTVESVTEPARPERFWTMMEQIWKDLKASGHVPRSAEEVEAERQTFRDEWDERQEALERIHLECERLRQQASPPGEKPQ
jgi:hypothetical protein